MNNKNILFITTAFSPENAVGSIRTTKIVKYLIKNNFKVTVISPKLHESTKLDYSNECIELDKVERILIPHSKLFESIFLKRRNKMIQKKSAANYLEVKNKKSIISVLKSQLFICIHFLYTFIRNKDWSREVNKYIVKNIDIQEYTGLISSYPSLSAHWISYKISKNHGLVWIADFRDPINYEANSNKIINKINSYFQNKIANKATYITSISEDIFFKFDIKNKTNTNKYICIPNGFDPADLQEQKVELNKNENKLNLCYVGSLYGGKRDLSVIFEAIEILINENKINKDLINFIYAGNEFDVLKNQAEKYNLSSLLVNRGFVSRLESVEIQSKSDLIVITTWNTKNDQGILTGKLFECLLTKKMILGVVNGTVPNSEMKRLVKKINGGFVFEESSLNYNEEFHELKEFILKLYLEKLKTENVVSTYNEKINDYTYSRITESIINLLEHS
ncbi:MAG: hypothetical protein COB12_11420 [Flavobacterium sp.]|nr:MAG: hypothetical protein COB12_11420 [Flavobacterium sp.]